MGPITKNIQRFLTLLMLLFSHISPRLDKKWIFIAGTGERFAENSKYLFLNELEKENGIKPIWIGSSEDVIAELNQKQFPAYSSQSLIGKFHLLTAGVAIETHGPQLGKYLGGAEVIDTHHGNALKIMGSDINQNEEGYINRIKGMVWNRLVSTSYFLVTNEGTPKDTFKDAFNIDESDILVSPYPRLDVFFREDSDFKIGLDAESLNQVKRSSNTRTVIFYTPTWRKAFGTQNGIPLSELMPDFKKINSLLQEIDGVLYVSTHPKEPLNISYSEYECIVPLNTGGDIYPFLQYCDVLVTDYSSIFYDFLFADQPLCFYAPDLELYQSSRGLYFDYEKHVPGPVSKSTDELIQDLKDAIEGKDKYDSKREERLTEFYTDSIRYPAEDTRRTIQERISSR